MRVEKCISQSKMTVLRRGTAACSLLDLSFHCVASACVLRQHIKVAAAVVNVRTVSLIVFVYCFFMNSIYEPHWKPIPIWDQSKNIPISNWLCKFSISCCPLFADPNQIHNLSMISFSSDPFFSFFFSFKLLSLDSPDNPHIVWHKLI